MTRRLLILGDGAHERLTADLIASRAGGALFTGEIRTPETPSAPPIRGRQAGASG